MGFFTSVELTNSSKVKVDVESLEGDCMKCGLYKDCNYPKLSYVGKGNKKILIIGEHTTANDDLYGVPFSGDSGDRLSRELRLLNVSMKNDTWVMNSVACFKNDKLPEKKHIAYCYPNVKKAILTLKPKVVLLMGTTAVNSLYGKEFSNREIERWRNFHIPDEEFTCFIIPIYHTSELIRKDKDKNLSELFKRDLKRAISCVNKEYPERIDYSEYVTVLKDYSSVVELLKGIYKRKESFLFDYETTGLKPYRKGHKIVTIGLALSKTRGYAFPFNYKSFWTKQEFRNIKRLWKRILKDKNIKKTAWNLKFEDSWSSVLVGKTKGYLRDPMLSSKVIDNRRASTGLKFQTFVQLGVRPYDKLIKPFLKSKKGSEFNSVEKAPFKELLIYNGLDCIYAQIIFENQQKYLDKMHKLKAADTFFNQGNLTMSTIQLNGIAMDYDYYKKADIELTKTIKKAQKYLTEGREATKFKEKFGREINLNSGPDLGKLFFEVLGKDPVYTDGSKDKKVKTYKTNKEVLTDLNLPFADKLLDMRRYTKAQGTYFGQFFREICNNKLHPFFSLNIAISLRSNSTNPNWQNTPKRDAEIATLIRKGVVPYKNHYFGEFDFGGAEVITSVSYHKDKNFYNYLVDPTTDMHRDCYSSDTKFLTKTGFKKYEEIKNNELIAQYNEKLDIIEYVNFSDRICHTYNGKMYHLKNRYIDILTTPNHRMYLKKLNLNFKIIKAKDITKSSYYVKTGANISNTTKYNDFYFEAVYGTKSNSTKKYHNEFKIKSNDMFELLGYLITDGHFKYHKQGAYRINLSQIKEPHKTKMKLCIDRIKSYTEFNFHEEKTRDKWSMSNKSLCTWLCENFGVNKVNRKLPNFIKFASKEQLQIFFDACMLGDGSYSRNKTSGTLYTVSTNFIEDFQFVCMRLGYSSRIKKGKLKENRTIPVYSIHMQFRSELHIKTQNSQYFGTETYKGKVVCFTVPSGLLVTSRNNKIAIQGNCATDLWMLPHDMLTGAKTDEQKKQAKMIRFYAKNCWTFAQFYGDWFASCGETLWKTCVTDNGGLVLPNGMRLVDHLENQGIVELGEVNKGQVTQHSFLEHCKEVENKMWNIRFPEYTQWKKDIVEFYQKYGYIETHFGFRYIGYMDNKQCCNYPIQGTSFHLLIYTLIEIQKFIDKNKLRTRICGQIHDSVISSIHKDEVKFYVEEVNKIVLGLKDRFEWLSVPMEMEYELSKLRENGGNFSKMKEHSYSDIMKGSYK